MTHLSSSAGIASNCLPHFRTMWADVILNQPEIGASITIPMGQDGNLKPKTIPCFMTDDFSFSLGNNWNKLASVDSDQFNGLLNTLGIFQKNGDGDQKGSTQVAIQSRYMEAASWTGSDLPTFSLSTVFVSTDRSYNPLNPIIELSRGALPTTKTEALYANKVGTKVTDVTADIVGGGISLLNGVYSAGKTIADNGGNVFSAFNAEAFSKHKIIEDTEKENLMKLVKEGSLYAPLGFGLTLSEDGGGLQPLENTTCMLCIGNWFYADKLIIDKISNISISKEVIAPFRPTDNPAAGNHNPLSPTEIGMVANTAKSKAGFPLWAKCNITFRPVMPITYNEFKNYFKRYTAPSV